MVLAMRLLLMSIIYIRGFASHNLSTSSSEIPARGVLVSAAYSDVIDAKYNISLHRGSRPRRQTASAGCVMPYSTSVETYSLKGPIKIEGGQLVPYYSLVELKCLPGYVNSKNRPILCNAETNDWYEELGTCLRMCKRPQSLTVDFTCIVLGDDGQLHRDPCNATIPSGSTASAKCRDGYHSMKNGYVITCYNGQWVYSMPSCTAECGRVTPRGTPHVINGTTAARAEFPWHVAIYSQYEREGENSTPKYSCGGSIITSTVAISAAHCFYVSSAKKKLSADLFKAAVGKVYSDFDHPEETMDELFIQKFDVKRIEIPEDYKGVTTSFSHDLALIILDHPIVFSDIIMPVCLNLIDKDFEERQTSAGQQAKVAGFGLTNVNGNASYDLKTAVMPIVSKQQCAMGSPEDFGKYIISDKLCAGQTDGVGVCQGDSGGGLVVKSFEKYNPIWHLRGVVSTSPRSKTNDACTANTYSLYTKPFYHSDFIQKVIERQGCEMPSDPPNGKFILIASKNASPGEGVRHKSRMILQCDRGFILSDREINTCNEFINDWVRDFAECVATASTSSRSSNTTRRQPQMEVTSGYDVVADTNQFHMFCYFTNGPSERRGVAEYTLLDNGFSLCSHIIYGYVTYDDEKQNLQADLWTQELDNDYEKVTSFKRRGKKVLLSLDISGYERSDKFSRMLHNASARHVFGIRTMKFIVSNNFDGLNLKWLYPACWRVNCEVRQTSDIEVFSAFIEELHSLFQPWDLLLSCIVPPNADIINHAYTIQNISESLDWIIVAAEGYHPAASSYAYHNSPLYSDSVNEIFDVESNIKYLLSKGAKRRQLILGTPLFGKTYNLTSIHEDDVDALARGDGDPGQLTNREEDLSHYEICDRVKNRGWHMVIDSEVKRRPYALGEDQLVSFDDVTSVRNKMAYVTSMRLGGAFAASLDMDDSRGLCGCGTYPLLSAAARELDLIKKAQLYCQWVPSELLNRRFNSSEGDNNSQKDKNNTNEEEDERETWHIFSD